MKIIFESTEALSITLWVRKTLFGSKAISGSHIDYLGSEILAVRFFPFFLFLENIKAIYPFALSLSKLKSGVNLSFYIFLDLYPGCREWQKPGISHAYVDREPVYLHHALLNLTRTQRASLLQLLSQ